VTIDEIASSGDLERIRSIALELSLRERSLRGENEVLLAEIVRLTRLLAEATDGDRQLSLNLEIRRLNEQLAEKNRELFGPSRSERRPRTKEEAPKPKEGQKKRGHGPTEQTRLPITEIVHTLDPEARVCPCCSLALPEMAGQTDDSEQVTLSERRIVLVRHRRTKYRCGGCGFVDMATAPAPVVPGGRYSPEFAAAVAVDKYADHLPLERQVVRFARQGLDVTSQTLWDQLLAVYHLLLPVWFALQAHLLRKGIVGVDESPWRLMKKGPSLRWWVWALVGDDAVFYMLAPTRGSDAARALLEDYSGVVMADGYSVYRSLERLGKEAEQLPLVALEPGALPRPRYTLVTCWMHARREFVQAEKNYPEAGVALDLIAELYAIEARADKEAAGDHALLLDARERLRTAESKPVVAKLRTWLDEQNPVPRLKMAEAVGYLRNQWDWLIRFLEDPRVPLDNGASERRMRGPVLGRKNHYGSRSELGTRVAATLYSIVETCKLLAVNPEAYLVAAIKEAQGPVKRVLTPMAYAARSEDA
jgi:transposase